MSEEERIRAKEAQIETLKVCNYKSLCDLSDKSSKMNEIFTHPVLQKVINQIKDDDDDSDDDSSDEDESSDSSDETSEDRY